MQKLVQILQKSFSKNQSAVFNKATRKMRRKNLRNEVSKCETMTFRANLAVLVLVVVVLFAPMLGIVPKVIAETAVETETTVGTEASAETEAPSAILPELYFSIIHPGYVQDGVQNVGELVAVSRRESSDAFISLAGLTLSYINSSGNEVVLFSFPENSYMAGETILLRLASSPGNELASWTYSKTLAFKGGPLTLKRADEIVDSVCWTGKAPCYKDFKSADPTVLKRNLETGEFEHISLIDYKEPAFLPGAVYMEGSDEASDIDGSSDLNESSRASGDSGNSGGSGGSGVSSDSSDEGGKGAATRAAKCQGIIFSEILSYYDTTQDEQFIELYNPTSEQIFLDGCNLRYKNKLYPLEGVIRPEGYLVRHASDFKLTKNPSSSNLLELIDANEKVIDRLEYFNGQRKGTAYALIGYAEDGEELWRTTYAPTPGEPNNYQEYRTCAEGKVINEATGNCVKVTTIAEKVCGEGQVLNILTGRCRKIETEAEQKTCAEGYYLNPVTNRCKKSQENTGATYEITPETYAESSNFVAIYLLLGVVVVGVGYIVYEFRSEISKWASKMFRKGRGG